VTEIASLVLFAADVNKTADFYRAIGLELEHEDHGEGPVHCAVELRGVHFAIYPAEQSGRAPARRAAGSSFPGFYVTALDEVTESLRRITTGRAAPGCAAYRRRPRSPRTGARPRPARGSYSTRAR
jgi:catechol 2,3-dioxygenase-like lactoylglutathione lyase family enzyme